MIIYIPANESIQEKQLFKMTWRLLIVHYQYTQVFPSLTATTSPQQQLQRAELLCITAPVHHRDKGVTEFPRELHKVVHLEPVVEKNP